MLSRTKNPQSELCGFYELQGKIRVDQGMRRTCPARIVSLVSPFALLITATEVPCFKLMR
jgi:hypothetical protein